MWGGVTLKSSRRESRRFPDAGAQKILVSFAEILVGLRTRTHDSLETMPPNVTAPNKEGLHLSMPLFRTLQPGQTTRPKGAPFTEVDIPAEPKDRAWPRAPGRFLSPTEGMADSFSKELGEARSASPPYSPFRARGPAQPAWRFDGPSRPCFWGDGKARQIRYGQSFPGRSPAQLVLFRLRRLSSAELAGARGGFGGRGAHLCLLSPHLVPTVENSIDVMGRLADEEGNPVTRAAGSRVDPQEVSPIITESGPDRCPRAPP